MKSIVPCLTFAGQAEAAVKLYVSIFRNSKIVHLMKSEADGPIPKGSLLHAAFELDGRPFTAMDGGPSFRFSQGFSLVATCESQAELDATWRKLLEGGGREERCGWLTDRFGVSWQVIPSALGEMMGNPSGGNTGKVMDALLKMDKIDIETLRRAYAAA